MGKLNRAPTLPATQVRTPSNTPDALTAEGGPGYTRDPKSELFLLAVTNMVGEKTFYESGKDRDARFEALAYQVIRDDPEWIAAFIPALRDRLHMRTASIVLAGLFAKARLEMGQTKPSIRTVIDQTLVRADEPAELLAFWLGRYGRKIPMPVKRGLADAAVRLYTERNALKWDSDRSTVRMGDVIELTHPTPSAPWQSTLFKYLIDDRHNRAEKLVLTEEDREDLRGGLAVVRARQKLEEVPMERRREMLTLEVAGQPVWPGMAKEAGVTWEWLSGWLQGPMDAVAWESVIPQMGYMALLRNLRNFDQAKISDEARQRVLDKLVNPEDVKGSRQLPLRFWSAFQAVGDGPWTNALEKALDLTLENIPTFEGRTLVMVDSSGSMHSSFSARGTSERFQLAGLFGAAIARRNEADLYAYDVTSKPIDVMGAEGVLKAVGAIKAAGLGGGTATWQCVQARYAGHDRVVIITDEQAHPGATHDVVPAHIPVYTFNVAGYSHGHAPSFNEARRYAFGGLSDAAFEAIALLDKGVAGFATAA